MCYIFYRALDFVLQNETRRDTGTVLLSASPEGHGDNRTVPMSFVLPRDNRTVPVSFQSQIIENLPLAVSLEGYMLAY